MRLNPATFSLCILLTGWSSSWVSPLWAAEPDDAIAHDFCLATPTGIVYDGLTDPLFFELHEVIIADGPFGPEDVDLYGFEVIAGQPVEVLIEVFGQAPPPVGLDPYIRLFDMLGTEIAFGEEFGTPFALMVHVISQPGIYYLGISSWMDDGFGGIVPAYYSPQICGGTAGPNYSLGWYDVFITMQSIAEPGACCQPDGACWEVPAVSCGGTFIGEGTTCAPGLCCLDSPECDDGIACNGVEACVDNVCVPGVPEDDPPIADANGPYTAIFEQPEPITLDASGSVEPNAPCDEIIWYDWDIDNDGTWDYGLPDALLDLPWMDLPAHGLDTIGIPYTIRLRVTDSAGNMDETTGIITILCGVDAHCDDGDPCTGDHCLGGVCAQTPVDCDDGDSMTIDYCDPGSGVCFHEPDPAYLYEPYVDCDTGLPPYNLTCATSRLRELPPRTGIPRSVHLFSGESVERETDLHIPGRGFDFVWQRTYRSRTGGPSLLGHNWAFSYDLYLVEDGAELVFYNGDGRRDRFVDSGAGIYTCPEYFRTLEALGPPGAYLMTLMHNTALTFDRVQPEPDAPSRLTAITDRNGNLMTFEYDGLGRLWRVRDTLNDAGLDNRVVELAYNVDGFLESVTDWVGRQVQYEYYQDGEQGGAFGDLKSVTSPAVVPTPDFPVPPGMGHEYPDGKTWTYTYSKDFALPWLNHNLLTVTDPRGQTILTHTYNDLDQVQTCDLGGTGQYQLVYIAGLTPGPENNGATAKTCVNDRAGDVQESFFDPDNRTVMYREYTGRADPSVPTNLDAALNPPLNPLRFDDPPYFESKYEYNDDSLCTYVILPSGADTIQSYDTANPSPRSRGNLLQRCRQPGPLGGDQPQICAAFEYDDGPGGTNLVTRHTDPRSNDTFYSREPLTGNMTRIDYAPVTQGALGDIPQLIFEEFEYNAHGQITGHVHPDNGTNARTDHYTYHDAGAQRGYLQSAVLDLGGHNVTSVYDYDAVGNFTTSTDPRGRTSTFVRNQHNQVVRHLSREVIDGSGVHYQTDYFYDANDNLVRRDVQNFDEQGVIQPNSHFTAITEYDILNYPLRRCRERGACDVPLGHFDCGGLPAAEFVTTEWAYDANHNLTLTRYGEAVNGNQPDNVLRTLYDERDLLYQVIRGEGTPDASSIQFDYQLNGNHGGRILKPLLRSVAQGLEGGARVWTWTYDGYDRPWDGVDPEGNYESYQYDAGGNLRSEIRYGELVEGESGTNIRLSERTYVYDEVNRLYQIDEAFFISVSGELISDGVATSRTYHFPSSDVQRTEDDNGQPTDFTYDTAGRLAVVTDAGNNTVTYTHDQNANIINATRVDKSDLPGAPDEIYYTNYTYDGLDRRIRTEDIAANREDFGYDSRDNLVIFVDALRPDNPTDPGNITRYEYDGLNRLTATTHYMTADGSGTGAPAGQISVTQLWDDSSRLSGEADDHGNITTYSYDPLNRLIDMNMADGTSRGYQYDVHDNPIWVIDANGSMVAQAYDALDRLTGRTILPGPGVAPTTTFETYKYDGRSRLVYAEDDDSLVTFSYDSLSNTLSETLNGQITGSQHDGVGNQLTCTYPGGRTISNTYDVLNRKKFISDGSGMLASYDYVGPGIGSGGAKFFPGISVGHTLQGAAGNDRFGLNNSIDAFGADRPISAASYDFSFDAPVPQRSQASSFGGFISDIGVQPLVLTLADTNWPEQRIARSDYVNNTRTDYEYDEVFRITSTYTRFNPDGVPANIDLRTYAWDRMNNRIQRQDVRPGGPQLTHDYAYDSIYRLTHTTVTDDNAVVVRDTAYELDGVGNRVAVTGEPDPGVYTMDPTLPEPADFQMNQYTTTPFDARVYDQNGNLREPGAVAVIEYDYRDQMVAYHDLTIASENRYSYDPLGRRIGRIVDAGGAADTTQYCYDGWQVVEEQDQLGNTLVTYVYGGGGGSPQLDRDWEPGGAYGAFDFTWWACGLYSTQKGARTLNPDPSPNIKFFAGQLLTARDFMHEQSYQTPMARSSRVSCFGSGVIGGFDFSRVDEVVNMQRNTGDGRSVKDYYYHADDMLNVMALTDEYGNVVERYAYGDYGESSVERCLWSVSDDDSVSAVDLAELLGAWGPNPGHPADFNDDGLVNAVDLAELLGHWGGCPQTSSLGNPYLFTGRRYDEETGLYYYRTRYLDPRAGRFVTRDTIGAWGDPENLGNAFSYVGNNPQSYADPLGLQKGVKFSGPKGPKRRTYNFRFKAQDLLDSGIRKSNIIISAADAKKLKPGTPASRLLQRCRVIIISGGSITAGGSFTTPHSKGGEFAMWSRNHG